LPRFLDEVKNHIGLAEVVGARVQLTKKGREYHGLCPFHNEKTPSFTVNEDKGFYHCFGCGEHGSVFDFVMKTDNMSFPEAVKKLADDAGIEIPLETREDRKRHERAKDLYGVMESATVYFEKLLFMPEGKPALNYLLNRGISEVSIKTFRLGFSGENNGSLKAALVRDGFQDNLMIEAGLLIKPDDSSRQAYDRFRGRVMFPITDRRERIIAFGGRVLGKGEPKYLNSPESPLFHKGHNLYALSRAVEAAQKTKTILVTEGYTDVIALHQVGFKHAVSPLGTALTEEQIQLMWRFVSEPILCFDGDGAGQKAAGRAAKRAIPILKPEKSLSFISLPEGEDPDSLIKTRGVRSLKNLLDQKIHLSEVVWQIETQAQRLETPEDRAGLEKRLRDVAMGVGDETVRRYYLNTFKSKLWDEFRASQQKGTPRLYKKNKRGELSFSVQMAEKSGAATRVNTIWLHQAILTVTLINHPQLFDVVGERLGRLAFKTPELDNLRQEVLKVLSSSPGLDYEAVRDHLEDTGFSELLNGLLSRQVINHANFARLDENIDVARNGWEQTFRLFRRSNLLEEIHAVEEELANNPTNETFELLKALKKTAMEKEDAEVYLSNVSNANGA
jgi:DNA primase